jgi:hypothetical protein
VEIFHFLPYIEDEEDAHTTSYTVSSFSIVSEESQYDGSNPWRARGKIL